MTATPPGPDQLLTAVAAVTASAVAVIQPSASDYLLIVLGAVIGAMHSVAKVETGSRTGAALFIIRWAGAAVILTSVVAHVIESTTGFPAGRWPGAVAFAITFMADSWPRWVDALFDLWLSRRSPPKE